MKRIILISILSLFTISSFAGYYSGGRSGYSASRSYSSGRISSPRSSYINPSRVTRTYFLPRNSQTTVHHNYYGHPGYGFGGGGFLSGFLGGYLGGTLANHNNGVMATPAIPQGQGMMMESGNMVATSSNVAHEVLLFLISVFIGFGIVWLIVRIWNEFHTVKHSRW